MLCMDVDLWISSKRVKDIYNNKSSANVSMNDPQNGRSMDGIALNGGVYELPSGTTNELTLIFHLGFRRSVLLQ